MLMQILHENIIIKTHTYSNNIFILTPFNTPSHNDSTSVISSHYEKLPSLLCQNFKIALYV